MLGIMLRDRVTNRMDSITKKNVDFINNKSDKRSEPKDHERETNYNAI